MDGGYGFTPSAVGGFTIDQVFMLLCDKKVLRMGERKRVSEYSSVAALGALSADENGLIPGRTRDGKVMRAQIKGKSKARQLAEDEENRKARESQNLPAVGPKKKRRRG